MPKNKNLNISLKKTSKKPEHRKINPTLAKKISKIVLIIVAATALSLFSYWVARVFSDDINLNPIAFQIAQFKVHWYGICFIIGFIPSLIYVLYRGRDEGESLDDTVNMVFIGAVFGMLGARLAFVALNLSYYLKHPLETLNIWEGGLTLYGAVLLGFIAILVYCKIRKLNTWKILDIFAPAMLLGQVFGRWGNFFNQELIGYPTRLFLKMYITPFNRPWEYRNDSFFHPVFLYESILSLVAFIILAVLAKKKKLKAGMIFALYLMIYSVIRFGIEFVRIEPKIFLHLTLGQLISALIFIIATIVLLILKKKK
ncbi:MAG TPA: prolipoprotein diacylglyceryl transferase [Patescibacteria group bacterium]|nr:prolipoprotein diacylglyceryl transferase [Patescibacteria group bacterium]